VELSKQDLAVLNQVVDDAIEVSESYVEQLDDETFRGDTDLPTHLANAADAGEDLAALRRIKGVIEID
jgi:hypothetical protein